MGGLALRLFALGIFLAGQVVAPAAVVAETAKTSWDPQHTWVFSVGVLQWQLKSMTKFTDNHRRDAALIEAFEKDGIPKDHIDYLQDKQATLKNIRARLATMLARTKPGDTLFLYYCGHGWMTNGVGYYGNYDSGDDNSSCWSTKTLAGDLAAFKGSNVIITVDCCQSGSVIKALQQTKPKFEWGILTAAVAGQDSTGNWTFSQSALDCLNGHRFADKNRDGVTSFDELGAYIKDEMKFFEHQDSAAAHSAGFPGSYVMGVVTTPDEKIPQRAQAKWEKDWWPVKIMETKGQEAKIHWISIGWDGPDSDEWVPMTRLRNITAPSVADAPTSSAAASATSGGATNSKLVVGAKVEVLWKEKWYPAQIVKVDGSKYYIHYDDYDDKWNEWLASDRIR